MLWILGLFLLISVCFGFGDNFSGTSFDELVGQAANHLNLNNLATAIVIMERAILLEPVNVNGLQFLGTLNILNGNPQAAVEHLHMASILSNWTEINAVSNLIEALRQSGNLVQARDIGMAAFASTHESRIGFNLAAVEVTANNLSEAIEILKEVFDLDPTHEEAWARCGSLLTDHADAGQAAAFLEKVVEKHPTSSRAHYMLAVAYHYQFKLDEALMHYKIAEYTDPTNWNLKASIGAAYQSLGRVDEALYYYELALPQLPNDASVRNNYGALLGVMNRKEEEVYWLQQALLLDPLMEHALVNLAGHRQDDGELDEAADLLTRAALTSKEAWLFKFRIACMLSPISSSWADMLAERHRVEALLFDLMTAGKAGLISKVPVSTSLDRIHFYIVYHSLNDRYMQELFVKCYELLLDNFSNTLAAQRMQPSISNLQQSIARETSLASAPLVVNDVGLVVPKRKVRVGFLSKFFAVFEPHGALLDGVMRYLPGTHFYVLALPVARTDGKPMAPNIVEFVDQVWEISLSNDHAIKQIMQLNLDILVFADTMSEPMTHFMAHVRLAPIQMAFWGNPITSASQAIDYFISADFLEHPFRTRMPVADEPYTEQVVLLEGQGIWYYRPESPESELRRANFSMMNLLNPAPVLRSDFGLSPDWFIFMCPQSTFKIHPLFDEVLANILRAAPHAHLVMTAGRRPLWTEKYVTRIMRALDEGDRWRLHVVARVSSERFNAFLKLGNAVLHPFPFDGSRTSADALVAGIPYVTMPTEYLRGRMGAAFLRTMNLPQLVARSASEYVKIAARLYNDQYFHSAMSTAIAERTHLIWEDMEYAFAWTKLLSLSAGLPVPSWPVFIAQTGRDVVLETELRAERADNQLQFDKAWGPEVWLLDNGVSVLETHLSSAAQQPRVFTDWASVSGQHVQYMSIEERYNNALHRPLVATGLSRGSSGSDHALHSEAKQSAHDVLSAITHARKSATTATTTTDKSREITITQSSHSPASPDSPAHGKSPVAGPPASINIKKPTSDALNEFRELAKAGRFEESYNLGASMHSQHSHDPLFVLELGAVQFFRGRYEAAYQHCSEAVKLAPHAMLAHACVGVASHYLGRENETLLSLAAAWQMSDDMENNGNYEQAFDHSYVQDDFKSSIFVLTKSAIEFNLISALRSFQRYDTCAEIISTMANIPTFSGYGRLIHIIFSFVDWQASSADSLQELQSRLQLEGLLPMPYNFGLGVSGDNAVSGMWEDLVRIQERIRPLLNPALDCMERSVDDATHAAVIADLVEIIGQHGKYSVTPPPAPQWMIERHHKLNNGLYTSRADAEPDIASGVVLISQYYLSSSPATQLDLNKALLFNLDNPTITEVAVVTEQELDFSSLTKSNKLRQYVISKRLTFKDALLFAQQYYPRHTVAIVNADIYFDDSLLRLGNVQQLNLQGTVLALLKWKMTGSARTDISLHLRTDSQDAWIMQTPLRNVSWVAPQADFFFGASRCDNRIAELFVRAGHPVENPAFALHAIEVQTQERSKGLYDMDGAAFGDGRDVLLSGRFEF